MITNNDHAVVARSWQSKYATKKPQALEGKRFGRLLVLENAGLFETNGGMQRHTKWKVRCDCGTEKLIRSASLLMGVVLSCGCLHKERSKEIKSRLTHGQSHTPEHDAWIEMRKRCKNPKNKFYYRYGGRGIKICERWEVFENFRSDMGPKPSPKHSVDRKDNDGDYTPENCRWATFVDQANNRRSNCVVEYGGESKTLAQWSRETGINQSLLRYRIQKAGWNLEKALHAPPGQFRIKRCKHESGVDNRSSCP